MLTDAPEAVRYRISHRTTYQYGMPMADGYTVAHLLPRPTAHQVVETAEVIVDPVPDERAERIDVFGNRVLQLGVHHAHDTLTLLAESEVVVAPATVTVPGEPWEVAAWRVAELRGGDALAVRPFAGSSPYVPLETHGAALREIAEEAFTPHRPVVDAARELCHFIYATFDYDPAFTDVSTPLSAVLAGRRGVCQDFAHLAAGCLRSLGLAARYVSGYIETDPPPGRPRLVGADASHAWCSLWVPQQGWIDFDPTNDRLPTHRHVTLAWGRDYGDVAPVRGVVIGPAVDQALTVEVDVQRVPAVAGA
jgi:transglutaminase-like putative cysteine protease